MSSTEIVLVKDLEELEKSVPIPETIYELPLFFAEKQKINPARFTHFDIAANRLIAKLDEMSGLSRVDETQVSLIPVNPGRSQYVHDYPHFLDPTKDLETYKIPEEDKSIESKAFVEMSYYLTGAEDWLDTRWPGTANPDGFVVKRAEYNGGIVFFVENHAHMNDESYMLWGVASGIPEPALEAQWARERQVAEARELGRVVTQDLSHLDEIDIERFRPAA
jgi:hypothetical protein